MLEDENKIQEEFGIRFNLCNIKGIPDKNFFSIQAVNMKHNKKYDML